MLPCPATSVITETGISGVVKERRRLVCCHQTGQLTQKSAARNNNNDARFAGRAVSADALAGFAEDGSRPLIRQAIKVALKSLNCS